MSGQRVLVMIILVLVFLLGPAPVAWSGEVALPGGGPHAKIMSLKELREKRVTRQQYDYSCGSAALATLLTYSYEWPVSEEDVFKFMYEVGDQKHIHQVGFSLLDMKKYVESLGMHASGYKLSLEQLRTLNIPVIILINPGGYNHFVVLRGWDGNSIVVADPYRGLRRIAISDFQQVWNGVVFVVQDDIATARANFNDTRDLKIVPHAPGSNSLGQGQDMSGFLLGLRGYNEF